MSSVTTALWRHLSDVTAQAAGDLQAPDAAGEHRSRCLCDLLSVPGRVKRQAELLRLVHEFVDWVQAYGDQDRVAGEGFLGTGDGLPVVVDLSDGN
jgi:hypothetical protein